VKIFGVGDSALCVEFGPGIDPRLNQKAIELAGQLDRLKWPEILDIVPAYSSVTVYFNPLRINRMSITSRLRETMNLRLEGVANAVRTHRVPVVYGREFGPDLETVAEMNGVSSDDVVRIHTGTRFRVYMLGFMPGFPYCGIVPEKIRAPRLSSPRTRIAAGSVGIAGAQTGIYPMESPGGWRLIGRTPLTLFDPKENQDRMFRFAAGDSLEFYSISEEDFHGWTN
jgi:inhibitor of KinA